jgi:hypothetical protein
MNKIKVGCTIIAAVLLLTFKASAQTWSIGYPDSSKVRATLHGDTLLISGSGEMKDYPMNKTWHDRIVGVRIEKGVTNIGHFAFYRCYQLRSVEISESVKQIGEFAFQDCIQLKGITLPNSLRLIQRDAFHGCKLLDSIIIPNQVTRIDKYAFFECFNLTKVLIKSKVLGHIGDDAFRACHKLSSITLPECLTKLGNIAFRECYSLERIEVEPGNKNYCSIDGVLFNKGRDTLLAYPNGKKGKYIVPESVSVIGSSAFACSKVDAVSIPNTVTAIEGDAFRYCHQLKQIIIPNYVSAIGVLALANCDSLLSITLGSGIKEINMYLVSQSNNLLEIKVDKNNTGLRSFQETLFTKRQDTLIMYPRGKKGKYVIPKKVRCIKRGAFEACEGLTEISIPKTVTTIEDLAFQYNRNLKVVTNMNPIPQPVSDEVFSYVKLKNLCLYVPQKAIDKYKSMKVWKDFGEIKAIR